MDRRTKLSLLFVSLFVISIPLNSTYVPTASAETPSSIDVNITDAWYEDGEGDGKENDVFSTVRFSLNSPYDVNSFDCLITLTLPSNTNYSYLVRVYTNMLVVELTNNFWNHGSEQGWYTITVSAMLHTEATPTDTSSLTFDPPGGDTSDPVSFTVD